MKEQKNKELRDKARRANLPLWEVADACGVTAGTLTVWLRKELTGEKRERVLTAINDLAEGRS